jgi:capsular polysaccharide biosynthesis protein
MVSPIEFLAEEAVRTMRDLVWKNLKISANAIPTRKLIVLRRGQVNRRTFDEHALVEQAVNAGYEEVYPEKMNFEDQVRLFSEASSIIALSGASLTNLIFARDEIAVVGISKSAVYSPTFVEISLALRQKHCWLLGQNQKLDNYLGVISSSYSLNHDEIAVALEWLAKNSEPNSPKKRRAKG